MDSELERLFTLKEALKNALSDRERIELLDRDPIVLQWLDQPSSLRTFAAMLSPDCELIIKSLIAIGQTDHLISFDPDSPISTEKFRALLDDLFPIEQFYKEIGGIIGYHWTMFSSLSLKQKNSALEGSYVYHRPPGIDISLQDPTVNTYILQGIFSLAFLAEIYPVGGAADRLKFFDLSNGLPLPAAKLKFCGHTLLEGLIRDVQAREYLFYKLFGEQITTPIAMMTSSEKDNHRHILELCEEKCWFGRPKDHFRIFCQPVVPTMDRNGKWCVTGSLKLLMKPGGHGVIWKVAKEEGVFNWLQELGRKKVLVRQINNPIAGVDYGLLAFCGVGFSRDMVFGFASCPRQVKSAEGVNILIEKKMPTESRYCLTNIEYCDFPKFSIEDVPVDPGSSYSQFPSNTNILFADINAVVDTVARCPIPGMLVNLKKMSFVDEGGNVLEREVARLESTMQNLADCFEQTVVDSTPFDDVSLKTYLTYNQRRKTISTTKKLFQSDSCLLETPEGCFYDILCNAHDLLTNHCAMDVPQVPSMDAYIQQGPPFLFFYHPALGPLFSVIGQKIRGGRIHPHAELKLEIAEADILNLNLKGSLVITAESIIGKIQEDGILEYSDRVACVHLHNVVIDNQGVDLSVPNSYWQGEVARLEQCEIRIQGDGQFFAENVVLSGALQIDVESGFRVTAFEEGGELKFKKQALKGSQKSWIYHLDDQGSILLEK